MTDLTKFFAPGAIAVIGATDDLHKIGAKVLAALIRHKFPGQLYPVNPTKAVVQGLPAYPSLGAIGQPVDQALIAIPARLVPACVRDCAAAGVSSVVIFSSGFTDAGEEGAKLQAELIEISRQTGIRISGPNAEGYFNPAAGIAATFSPAINIDPGARQGTKRIGIVSQSGGLGFAFFNRGRRDDLMFSKIVSVGNQADLEIVDYLDHLIDDAETDVIMMYVESFKSPERFVASARRAAERGKPIVMVKVGKSSAGRRAAESHTGAIASSVTVIDAVLDLNGIIRADDQDRLLDCAAALANCPPLAGNRIGIVSASGGTGVWLADAVEGAGFEAPPIPERDQARMAEYIPEYGSTNNPVDITAQGVNGYARSLEILGTSDYIDAIILAATFSHEGRLINEGAEIARLSRELGKPVLLYSYTLPSEGSRQLLRDLGLHCFTSIHGCVAALQTLRTWSDFQANREDRLPAPRSEACVPQQGAALLDSLSGTLCEYEAKDLLRAWGVPVAAEILAATAEEAVAAAEQIGYPVVLKLQSPQIPHKTEAGVIRLGVADAAAVRAAFAEILQNGLAYAPQAEVRGILVQPMARRGIEMIAGVVNDPDFGPMIMTGLGGIFVEVLADVQIAPAPLTKATARRMLGALKGAMVLKGARGAAPADTEAMSDLLVSLSQMAWDCRERLSEFDINPVFLHPEGQGYSIVDALAVLAPKEG